MSEQSAIERQADATATMESARPSTVYIPNVDVLETDDELLLLADVPGSSSDSIEVRYEDGELSIHGRVEDRHPEKARCLLHQYGVGHFKRSFQINERIDASRIEAEYAQGVLRVQLPKVEAAKPRTIKVSSHN